MKNKLKEKIINFILTNKIIRSLRLFYQKFVAGFFIRYFVSLLFLAIFCGLILNHFWPNFFAASSHKISSYFYHYLKIDNIKFRKINITGISYIKEKDILNIINDFSKNNDIKEENIVAKLGKKIKEKISWIDQIKISRSLPYDLNIVIEEFKPFAILLKDKQKYFTNKDGKLVDYEDLEEFKYMVILSGESANKNVESLFNIFFDDPKLSSNVYSANWVSNRRWDIIFEEGFLVKLPEKNIDLAWKKLADILNMQGSTIGLKAIDLRVSDKVFLEYEDGFLE